MKILVTGIAGLIGGNFAQYLLEHTDHEVVGIDDLSCGLADNIPDCPWHNYTLGSLNDATPIFEEEQPDVVYHFAAYAAECLSPFIRRYNYTNNTVATAEVVTACLRAGVQRLVFTSSMAVYGSGDPPFDENDRMWPIDPYGVAKMACEHDIRIAGEQHGLDYVILRPHNVYGPGQVITQVFRNVFGIWMWRHMNNEPMLVYGDGRQQRAFSYIDDMLEPLLIAGTSPAVSRETINLGGEEPTAIYDAAVTLGKVMGGAHIEYAEGRHEVHQAWCTVDKSKQMLNFKQRHSLEEGLSEMWQWAQVVEHKPSQLPKFELVDGLPSYWKNL